MSPTLTQEPDLQDAEAQETAPEADAEPKKDADLSKSEGGEGGISYAGSGSEDEDGQPSKRRLSLRLKKKKLILSFVTLGMLGTIFGGTLFVGKAFEVVQLGVLLQSVYMFDSEQIGDNRVSKAIRWLKYKDTPQNLRMGFVGNKVADRVTARLQRDGFDIKYNNAGYAFEVRIPPEGVNDFLAEQKKLPDNQKATVSTDLETRELIVDMSDVNNAQRRNVFRGITNESYGKIASFVSSRLLIKRAGVTFRPFGNVKREARESVVDFQKRVKDDLRDKVKNGSDTAKNRILDLDTDEADPNTDPDAEKNNKDLNDAKNDVDDAVNTGGKDGNVKKVKVKSKILSASGLVLSICIVKDLSENVTQIQEADIVRPLIRQFNIISSAASQVLSGNGIGFSELEVLSESLYDDGNLDPDIGAGEQYRTPSSAFENAPLQSELGQEITGEDIPETARINQEDNALVQFVNENDDVETFCNTVNSRVGQIIQWGVNAVTTPWTTLFEVATGGALQNAAFEFLSSFLAGQAVNYDLAGSPFGAGGAHGGAHASNNILLPLGGESMSNREVGQWKNERLEAQRHENKQRPFNERYFALTNPFSLVSRVHRALPKGATSALTMLAELPSQIIKNTATAFDPSGAVNAQDEDSNEVYDYGFERYGFSIEELNDPRFDNPFENAEILYSRYTGEDFQNLHDEIGVACFGIRMTENANGGSVEYLNSTAYKDREDECNDAKEGVGISGEDYQRYRFYLLDTTVLSAVACFEGESDNLCEEFGITDDPTGNERQTYRPVVEGNFVWPVQDPKLPPNGGCWNDIRSSRGGGTRGHGGLDFSVVQGTPIVAVASGVVVRTSSSSASGSYGNVVLIDHGVFENGQQLFSLYAHAQRLNVSEGDRVEQGEVVIFSGDTGSPGVYHLHFGMYDETGIPEGRMPPSLSSVAVNPLDYITDDGRGYGRECIPGPVGDKVDPWPGQTYNPLGL